MQNRYLEISALMFIKLHGTITILLFVGCHWYSCLCNWILMAHKVHVAFRLCISNCFSTNFDISECKPDKLQCGYLYLLLLSSSHYREHIFIYIAVRHNLLAFNGKDYCKFFLKSEYTYQTKERKLVLPLASSILWK